MAFHTWVSLLRKLTLKDNDNQIPNLELTLVIYRIKKMNTHFKFHRNKVNFFHFFLLSGEPVCTGSAFKVSKIHKRKTLNICVGSNGNFILSVCWESEIIEEFLWADCITPHRTGTHFAPPALIFLQLKWKKKNRSTFLSQCFSSEAPSSIYIFVYYYTHSLHDKY